CTVLIAETQRRERREDQHRICPCFRGKFRLTGHDPRSLTTDTSRDVQSWNFGLDGACDFGALLLVEGSSLAGVSIRDDAGNAWNRFQPPTVGNQAFEINFALLIERRDDRGCDSAQI